MNNNINQKKDLKGQSVRNLGYMLLVIIVFFVVIKFIIDKNDTYNVSEYTVNIGEVLPIFEMDGKYNFNIKVLDIEENYILNIDNYSGGCLAIKVEIRNNSDKVITFPMPAVSFSVLTSSNEIVVNSNNIYKNIILNNVDDNLLLKVLGNKVEEGYIFFCNNGQTSNFDEITKLMITVPKEEVNKGSYIDAIYGYYYINLK